MTKRRLSGCLIIILLPGLVYIIATFGYCRGWWGKDNLILRSLWLCTCSKNFEQSLYPENVEVLVSACGCDDGHRKSFPGESLVRKCEMPQFRGVPGGRFIQVGANLIDLYTNREEPLILPPRSSLVDWLTEDLLLIWTGNEYSIFSRSTQQTIGYTELAIDQSLNLDRVLGTMENAEKVIIFHNNGSIVVLGQDYKNHPERNMLILSLKSLSLPNQDTIEAFLVKNGIIYERGEVYYDEFEGTSPSGRFRATWEGVYETVTGKKVFDYGLPVLPSQVRSSVYGGVVRFFPIYWRSDEKEIILIISRHVLGGSPVYTVFAPLPSDWVGELGIYLNLPQPVLKIILPEKIIQSVP